MKNQSITIFTLEHDPAVESMIQKKDAELKELARKNAKHFAQRNLPNPEGDKLIHYVGEAKTGYERLAADVAKFTQPNAHFPEGKMDLDFFKEKDNSLAEEAKTLADKNLNDTHDLGNFNPGNLALRIRVVIVASLILMLGEIIFNAKAFQIIGENLLFALFLSISITLAVMIFSHISPFLYKAAKNRLQRIWVVVGSLFLTIGVFIVLAILRSSYLATHGVHISPTYFVVFNLFFFVVSALLSFFLLPSWQEIKQDARKLKLYNTIAKRGKRIVAIHDERELLKADINKHSKYRIRTIHHANYSADAIRKMYYETVQVFIMTNLIYRTDGRTPVCFSDIPAEPNIDEIIIPNIPANRKAS